MTIDNILAQRFAVNSTNYNIIRNAIIQGLADGSITEKDVNKSPDSVINKLISKLIAVKGNVTTGTVTINGIAYLGDGERYEEYDNSNNGSNTIQDSAALINMFNSALSATNASLKASIDTLDAKTDTNFSNTINLGEHSSYHTIKGDIDYSDKVIATAFNPVLYTGNGISNFINTDVDMVTQHGSTVNETCGGMVWIKSLETTDTSYIGSTVLGSMKFRVNTDDGGVTPLQNTGSYDIESMSSTGFTLNNAGTATNTVGKKYISYSFGTTHRKSATDGSVELITNGDFSNGTTGWNNNGLLSITITNGVLIATDNNTTDGKLYRDITTTIGSLYTVKADCVGLTGGIASIQIGNTSDVYDSTLDRSLQYGKNIVTFKATNTTTRIAITSAVATTSMSIDNVSCKECLYPTNHDKYWESHYNPVSGFSTWLHEGSGRQWHGIPNPMLRQIDMLNTKCLNTTGIIFQVSTNFDGRLGLNVDHANLNDGVNITLGKDSFAIGEGTNVDVNASGNLYFSFGFASSYVDENNELVGNFEVGKYSAENITNVVSKRVALRDNPGMIMIKNRSAVSNWVVADKARNNFGVMFNPNKNIVQSQLALAVGDKSFSPYNAGDINIGTPGSSYFYLVCYANESSTSTRSRYKRPSATSVVNVNDLLTPLPTGINSRISGIKTLSKTETITNLTYTAGDNYLFIDSLGNYINSKVNPKYSWNIDTTIVNGVGFREYEYDINKQKWYKIITSNIGEYNKKDTLNYFGDNSCIACYRFDGNLTELSGFYNATGTGIKYNNYGIFGQYGIIDTTSVMNINSNPIPFTTKNISFSNWLYGEVNSWNSHFGFGRKSNNVAYNGMSFIRMLGGFFSCGSYPTNYTTLNMTVGRTGWNHYVISIDVTNSKFLGYVNGVLTDSWNIDSTHLSYINAYSTLYGLNEETTVGLSHGVIIEQIRIFNRVLTQDEVKSLYYTNSYLYQDVLVSYLDHNVKCVSNGKIVDVIKTPKTRYVDKLVVNELEITSKFKPTTKKWYLETANRKLGYTYYNTSGEDMIINVCIDTSAAWQGMWASVVCNGINIVNAFNVGSTSGMQISGNITVPAGSSYVVIANGGTINHWGEYRILKEISK